LSPKSDDLQKYTRMEMTEEATGKRKALYHSNTGLQYALNFITSQGK